jgi:hypothetical protein
MRAIHLDAVGGIAGDMFVAAMLDAFPDLRERVLADAAAVLPDEAGTAELVEGESGAVRALRFGLSTKKERAERRKAERTAENHAHHHAHAEAHSHAHAEAHGGHHHHDDGHHDHPHHHHTAGDGSFRDMVARIEAARLSPGTAAEAVAILTIIARAEAKIHRVPLDDVHFHEIADWDSLLDVVAAGSIAAALKGARWTVSPLPRGGGLVHTAHGLLPVPAPATAEILQGFAWRDDGVSGERVTPTGAAIVRHLVQPANSMAEGRLIASGTGAGTRSLPGMPNIVRVLAFEPVGAAAADTVAVIAFEVDDMTGEEIGTATDRLRGVTGVLDVSLTQRWGKKGRPMQSFAVLARPEAADVVAERCFAETSTIGLRLHEERRIVLGRTASEVGGIGIKTVERPGGRTAKAESDHLTGDSLAARRTAKQRAEGGRDD